MHPKVCWQKTCAKDKSAHNEIWDFYAHMALTHERRFARCFCRDAGNTFRWQRYTRFAKIYLLLHFVVFAHRSTTTPRSFASRRGKYFLCKLPWNLAARNFGAGKAAGRKLTGRKSRTRTKHALKFQPVQACVLLSTEGNFCVNDSSLGMAKGTDFL